MKPLIIYHANCPDGWCAAWVCYRHFAGNVELHPGKYGERPPDCSGREVYVVDFSYPRDVLEEMAAVATSIRVLDHHKTAQDALQGLPYAEFDMDRSGAGMAWDHFNPGQCRPWLVDYVEDHDLWRHQLIGSEQINAYISSLPFEMWAWEDHFGYEVPLHVLKGGESVTRFVSKMTSEWRKTLVHTLNIGGYNVPCINVPKMKGMPEALHELAKGAPFSAAWRYQDGKYDFSLRSTDEGVDVAEIALQYGGGGHRNAAGFTVDCLEDLDIAGELSRLWSDEYTREIRSLRRELLQDVNEDP